MLEVDLLDIDFPSFANLGNGLGKGCHMLVSGTYVVIWTHFGMPRLRSGLRLVSAISLDGSMVHEMDEEGGRVKGGNVHLKAASSVYYHDQPSSSSRV